MGLLGLLGVEVVATVLQHTGREGMGREGTGGLEFLEFAYFEVFGFVVEHEANQGGLLVEALPASGAGIDVEHVVRLVVHHPQDVGVAVDEDVGVLAVEDG